MIDQSRLSGVKCNQLKLCAFFEYHLVILLLFLSVLGCSASADWNNPYPTPSAQSKILYSNFSAPPKHLDPVVSYSSNEWAFLSQIYEPPLQYHYFKRPYTLEPLTLTSMPETRYLDQQGNILQANQQAQAAFTDYHFYLRDDVRYQPHPAFVKTGSQFLYHQLTSQQLESIKSVNDFAQTASRKLRAEDYVYAIKRMALRQNHSPILDSMIPYIVGLSEFSTEITERYAQQLKAEAKTVKNLFFDLNSSEIAGVKVHSETHFSIRIKGSYPQFLYWLTMNFFAPIPWEADKFYKQQGLAEKNITLDTSPVGTGPYYLAENNPYQVMRLKKNPNFHLELYPNGGLPLGASQLLLADAGKPLPLIDEVVYTLEKESVPLWNKFLQGYYDASGVSSDSFDQAVSISSGGDMSLTDQMRAKGIQFLNAVQPTIFYMGFNMADPVVGGYTQEQRKLRQAISIAINYEEYISIFMNGRGIAAQGPVPPGIFGFDEKRFNPYVYQVHDGRTQRKTLDEAKQLLAEAGYPEGKQQDGTPLKIFYDTASTGPDSQSLLNWYRKQFAKLGIELVIRATDYNRFQSKVRGAKVQLFSWGWNADYPDPENFMFLLFGDNATINTDGSGINSANYDNPEFNRLFSAMKPMPNSPERLKIVQQMIDIVQKDAPWVWGVHPKSLVLYHAWLHNFWPNPLANNTLKYRNLDPQERALKRNQWNAPVLWPIGLLLVALLVSIIPLSYAYRRRQATKIAVTNGFTDRGGR
ncbi:ABC transporter substrate-binding protein [Thiosulfatimonas sediminis]|uniref:ABC transporter substrate-binding protein n=1 Tax=Thiosulfatimonas sediminis TaxID=2675054 RepID=A0A6F8PV42_9GAMM|nr:ABC transporter substrate-binding protein [Thiosulfatimonas sediminis]BBP46001.1 ABC transporter substrate-binding protein [Thiosulfatimonas sediminis]